jgi:hypothetical protein
LSSGTACVSTFSPAVGDAAFQQYQAHRLMTNFIKKEPIRLRRQEERR